MRRSLIVLLLHACSQDNEFFCGTPSNVQTNVIRLCDRPTEVCVCATYSCAVPASVSACPSGYIYVDEPFAGSKVAGKCVDSSETHTIIAHGDLSSCHAAVDASVADAAAPDTVPRVEPTAVPGAITLSATGRE